jgi:hypothetical protein
MDGSGCLYRADTGCMNGAVQRGFTGKKKGNKKFSNS